MKILKNICLLVAALMCISGCTENILPVSSNNNNTTEAITEATNANGYQETVTPTPATTKNTELTLDTAYVMQAGGKNYILIEATFKNNSSMNMSFYDAYAMQVFQNGIELHQNNSWTCNDFDLRLCASQLQSGYSAKIYMGFETSDINSSVSIECKSLLGNDVVKTLLSLDKSRYQQQKTEKQQEKVVVVHDYPPAGNYNGYYVCMGLSMNEAYSLMTSAEKSIVANNQDNRTLVNEQYAKHGYCFSNNYWHNYFYGYTH